MRGTLRRIASPANAAASFAAPITTITAIPITQARCASPVVAYAGPTTPNVSAKSEGVSMPSGIAQTSCRRSRCASRHASAA